ncbi:hypothetical protein GQ53DRAFT_838520 [Thozetella sp. PMI_491]|nr:hypothetical protein GQ53DRAFT_838520 [Thozetella sp. PMI_491]
MGRISDNFKAKAFSWLSALFAFSVALACYFYVQIVLINEAPPPNFLQLSPGRTILVVNVFAHIVAFLIWGQISASLEAWRWALASRQKEGLSLGSFLALSRAVGPLAVASLILLPRPGPHLFYCLKRLSFMGLAWVLGIVLTSSVEFKNIYTPTGQQEAAVYAGLSPVSEDLLHALFNSTISASLTSFFFMGLSYSLLSDNRFSVPIQPVSCSGPSCSSFFLPGGAPWIRRQDDGSMLFNSSGQDWDYKEAVLVNNAPGYHLEFYPPPDGWSFDTAADCAAYGQTEKEGLYVCLANHGTDLIAGWSVCPWDIYYGVGCFNDTSWQDQIDQTTTMTIQRRNATVAYSGANFTILSMESVSEPETVAVAAQLGRFAISEILAPIPQSLNVSNANWTNTAMISSIHYEIGMALRLYKLLYPDFQAPPLGFLYNYLSIPFQCSTGIYYVTGNIPPNLKTSATIVTLVYRAIAAPWVLTVYGAIALFLSLWAMAVLALACIYGAEIPSATRYAELDIISSQPAEPGKGFEVAPRPDNIDLGRLPQGRLDQGGVWNRIRGWAAGNRGVLELISHRRIQFGHASVADKTESGYTTRTFITTEEYAGSEKEPLQTPADPEGPGNTGDEDATDASTMSLASGTTRHAPVRWSTR